MKNEVENFKNYIKNNKKSIIMLLILAIITYSIKLFNYSISIDSEVTINDLNSNDLPWIATGRWAVVLFEKIIHFGHRFNPFFSNIVMVMFLVLCTCIVSYTFSSILKQKNQEPMLLIVGSIIITSPLLAEMLNFTLMTAEVAIGLCFLTSSIYFTYLAIYNKQKKAYIMAIILLFISMGCYQAFFPLYVGLIALVFFMQKEKVDTNIKQDLLNALKIIIVFAISYVLCSLMTKLLETHYNLLSSSYLTDQIRWGKISSSIIIYEIVKNIAFTLVSGSYNCMYTFTYLIVIIISLIYSIKKIIKYKQKAVVQVLALIFILLSPYFLLILIGNPSAYRTQMNFPFVTGILLAYFFYTSKNKKFKEFIILVTFITVFIQLKSTLDLFYSDYIRYQEDKTITESIFNKIDNIDNLPEGNRENVSVIFVGAHSTKSTGLVCKGDTLGFSFYEWDQPTEFGSNKRIYGFAKTLGYKYQMPTVKQIKEAKKIQSKLDIYPSKNSIKVIDNFVVVRLS
jgi:hypothetical protein